MDSSNLILVACGFEGLKLLEGLLKVSADLITRVVDKRSLICSASTTCKEVDSDLGIGDDLRVANGEKLIHSLGLGVASVNKLDRHAKSVDLDLVDLFRRKARVFLPGLLQASVGVGILISDV